MINDSGTPMLESDGRLQHQGAQQLLGWNRRPTDVRIHLRKRGDSSANTRSVITRIARSG